MQGSLQPPKALRVPGKVEAAGDQPGGCTSAAGSASPLDALAVNSTDQVLEICSLFYMLALTVAALHTCEI